ncbi:alkaline phosphatase D family protein [Aquimarina sp. 2201CG5-10]|uniref:alkaline phosphatase D family protein n=1 Tax=Aquimarina callyspongiae TaxID=3098150 RepID=UPI002AB586A3|nr:alkaline phosphatase D family protein [Aquimarina sp. 2201CG5-10]MDY8134168.1 alkaline phosphatase D family protein [Aquimarina sp. 2201CG5-10]
MKRNILLNICIRIFLPITVLTFTGCLQNGKEEYTFKSDFNTPEKRNWIGPEYWSNPLQDWQIIDGRLECLASGPNRNVHLLTQKLDTTRGNLKMKINLKLFNTKESNADINWVGFNIGSQGEYNDYRDDAVFGKGLPVGITTNGNLFIGKFPEENQKDEGIQKMLQQGVDLELNIFLIESIYQIEIAVVHSQTKEVLKALSQNQINKEKLVGDLVLVSHYNTKKKDPDRNQKSVSFKNWEISGSKLKECNTCTFGPIAFSQYTLSRGVLKLTAQMTPVIITDQKVRLQVKENDAWKTISESPINKDARTATFKIEKWDIKKDIQYRLSYTMNKSDVSEKEYYWSGVIRKEPLDKEEIVIAGFTGNDHLGFPNTDIFKQIDYHNPDVLFFSGDQLYESNGGYGAQRAPYEKATLDYLRKWYLYGWAYRDLLKNRPTVSITDDHDVYHGNIWGESGKATPKEYGQGSKAQDAGGYKMPAQWVKMVERTQTSHLPDPFDNTPVEQSIGTYYTDMVYGGISFAILEDRKFKSAPKKHLPKADIKNGWVQNKDFDVKKHGDVEGAKLLGERQLLFLNEWAKDWSYQAEMKVLLSQTIFANVATLPKEAMSGAVIPSLRIMNKGDYAINDRPVADLDSNGWPQTGRNKAIKAIRKGFAFHIAGDQHLGSTIQYGVEEWNDSGYALCVPSITNHWPRRWYPLIEGGNRDPEKPRYTGEYADGFGNKMTVHAVSNPLYTGKKPSKLYDRAAGYGIVKLNKKSRSIIIECWPRHAKPQEGDKIQYDGWPIKISQEDNYGRKPQAFLPEIEIKGLKKPVVQVINEVSKEIEYTIRIDKGIFKPKIFDKKAVYSVRVGEPDTNTWQTVSGIKPAGDKLIFSFDN